MTQHLRRIRSFVRREGRLTTGQRHALESYAVDYVLTLDQGVLDFPKTFGRVAPVIVEIGFGMGHSLLEMAKQHPEQDYLGIEVHPPGVGSLLMEIREHQINNLKVINYDAVKVIKDMIMENTIHGFHIFFPDPWHKKRHNKRRIIQKEFIDVLCSKLKPGGYIHLATDWEDYAIWMLDILKNNLQLENTSKTNDFIPRPEQRPETKFEQRGLNLGHGVWDLIFNKKDI